MLLILVVKGGTWRTIAKLMFWAQHLEVTAGRTDLLSHFLPLLTGPSREKAEVLETRSNKQNKQRVQVQQGSSSQAEPSTSNIYLFVLVNWELWWGSHSPFSWKQLSTPPVFHPPHSRSSWNLVFLLSSASLQKTFGPLFRSPRV